ncbi:MAG: type II secretion system major pseudopilin GspG [Candidatus Dependentiae bacterium]|nr:type II secretion system major pseudopilin GspG [Candidatus Dependentiae bacterium]
MIYAHKQARDGFTLMELLIAIAILGIISVVVIPNFLGYLESAKKSQVTQTLKTFASAIDLYNVQVGHYPTKLKDLVKAPADEKDRKKWQEGGYLGKVKDDTFEDPWGNNYHYAANQPGSSHAYELHSFGPNGKSSSKNEWISVWD